MEKEIHRHLESVERLEDSVDDKIEQLFNKIDIKEVFDDPAAALLELTGALDHILDTEFHDKALKEGIRFGKALSKNGVQITDRQQDKVPA